jgi:hypothetical protein
MNNEKENLKKKIDEERRIIDNFIDDAKRRNALIPGLMRRQREIEGKYVVLNNMPDDHLDESIPRLVHLQAEDTLRLRTALPGISGFKPDDVLANMGTSSSATYYSIATGTFPTEPYQVPDWGVPIVTTYVSLANELTRNDQLSTTLGKLSDKLATIYKLAIRNVEEARAGTIGIDQALIRLRDTIESLWGHALEVARARCSGAMKSVQSSRLQNSETRTAVAKCMARQGSFSSLVDSLDRLSELHSRLSAPSKNPLEDSKSRLDAFYAEWTLQLERLAKSLDT